MSPVLWVLTNHLPVFLHRIQNRRRTWQSVEKCHRGIFRPRQVKTKASHGSQNTDLRRYLRHRIPAMSQPVELFNGLSESPDRRTA